jgi:hypothetical protein
MPRRKITSFGETTTMISTIRRLTASATVAPALAVALAAAPSVADAATPIPIPTVAGPVASAMPGDPSRNYTFLATPLDLAARGYVEEEYFISGSACRYAIPVAPPGAPSGTAAVRDCGWPYQTRIVVRRPASAAAFNGTVIAEWQNVTAQYDVDHYWLESSEHLMRAGYAWVGVSAQVAGIQARPGEPLPFTVNRLKSWSPGRYGSLDVTGLGRLFDDGLRFDIFSQAVKVLRAPVDVDPLGPLDPVVVIAAGTSQSGGNLAAYHNSIAPLYERVVDAYFIGESSAALRTDQPVPVLRLLSEVDVRPTFAPPDAPNYRHWEVAGSSHADFGFIDTIQPLLIRDQVVQVAPVCARNPLSRIPKRYVYHAAWDAMVDWVGSGVLPPVAPRITYTGIAIARDADGNALGGIRLAEHHVPTAFNGTGNSPAGFCTLFGVHEPFSSERLAALYRNHGRYVSQVARVNAANVAAGFLVPADSEESTSNAARSGVGKR